MIYPIGLQQVIEILLVAGVIYLLFKHSWDAIQEHKKFKEVHLLIDEVERLLLKALETEDEEEKKKIKQEILSKLDDYKL